MSAFLSKLLGSKIVSLSSLALVLILLIVVTVTQLQKRNRDNKIEELNKVVDNKEKDIVELSRQVEVKDLEIQYLKKSIIITNSYEKEKEKVLENGTTTKVQVLDSVMSKEENKSWWDTPVPNDVLDFLICH